MLLAIEDVHWADGPTLLLLRHLARSAGNARMLVVATFRDTKARDPRASCPRRSSTCAAWRASSECGLSGLSDEEVAEFVRRAGGDDLDPATEELARDISELTDGNAFLMIELWRTLE